MDARRVIVLVAMVGVALVCSGASPWTLTPIATSPTGVSAFSDAVVVNGVVVYVQAGAGSGLKQWANGLTTTLADKTTPIPGGGGNFSSYSAPAFDGTHVVFLGFDPFTKDGVYELGNGTFSKIIDNSTPAPGNPSQTLDTFSSLSVSGTLTGFQAISSAHVNGVYSADTGGLHLVATAGTPGPAGAFSTFSAASGAFVGNGGIDFNGYGINASNQADNGVFRSVNGQISTLVDVKTASPGGGLFLSANISAVDGADFTGVGATTDGGGIIYKVLNGVAYTVADFHHSLPGLTGNVAFAGTASIADGSIVFEAGDSTRDGIFTDYGGIVSNVIVDGQQLDGKLVTNSFITNQAFDGVHVVIEVDFSDNTSALYMMTVPEPSKVLGIIFIPALLLRRRQFS